MSTKASFKPDGSSCTESWPFICFTNLPFLPSFYMRRRNLLGAGFFLYPCKNSGLKVAIIQTDSPKPCHPPRRRRADTAGTPGSGCSRPTRTARDLMGNIYAIFVSLYYTVETGYKVTGYKVNLVIVYSCNCPL